MKEEIIENLFDILQDEYQYYQQLNKLALAKKEALINNEIEDLSELIQQDNQVIEVIEECEEQRNDIIASVIEEYEIEKDDITYQQLIQYLPESWRERLDKVRQELLLIIEQLHENNEHNKVLIKQALQLNNTTFKMLTEILEPDNKTYDKKQIVDKNKVKHIVDRRG